MRKEIRGYDPVAVDAFLARCLATPGVYRSALPELRRLMPGGDRVTSQEVREVRFGTAWLGYRIRQVDALLDRIEAAVDVSLAVTTWRAPETPRDPAAAAAPEPRVISLVDTPTGAPART